MKILLVKIYLLLVIIFSSSAHAICNNANVKGSYNVVYSGSGVAGYGVYTFDGLSNYTLFGSLRKFGSVYYVGRENKKYVVSTGGKYTMDESCKLIFIHTMNVGGVNNFRRVETGIFLVSNGIGISAKGKIDDMTIKFNRK